MNPEITLYTTTTCPVCAMVRNLLATLNVDFKEVNVDLHPIAMIKLIGKTRRLTVPQTNINGKWIFGFDPTRMLEMIYEGHGVGSSVPQDR